MGRKDKLPGALTPSAEHPKAAWSFDRAAFLFCLGSFVNRFRQPHLAAGETKMLDDFSKAESKIRELRIPLATLSALCGISNAELSTLFNRQRPCTSEKAARIWASVKNLVMLVDIAAPIPIDFRRAESLKSAIEKIESDGLAAIQMGEIIGE